jgi:CheY-like chemotaxis protein
VTGPSSSKLVAGLERLVARERAARLEAERVAEAQLRRSDERSREVGLLASIAAAVNESDDALSALGAAAKMLRRHCYFAVSHVLLPDDDGAFVTADIWDADPGQLDFLERVVAATADERFPPPHGLPGEVAASHLALWLPDLSTAARHPRARAITAGAAWAFPVVTGVEVAAVVEFVHPTPRGADERLLQLAPSIATQLGRAFGWQRLRERQDGDRRGLEELLARRNEDVDALRREHRAADEARAAHLAYLAHEAENEMARLRVTGAVDPAATADLADLVSHLVSVADRTSGRTLGERTLIAPDALVARFVARFSGSSVPVVGLPSGSHPDLVTSVHVPSVERVVTALIDDAVAHPGTDRVEVALEVGAEELTVEVREHGAGPGRAQDCARPSGPGGLPQAARLARALGGRLQVTAGPGGGSVSRVRVPARSGGPAAWTVGGTRVLLVDDNDINRRLAAAMLDRIGLTADVVDSAEAALLAMRATAYGLVLMDVRLPGMDGREATRAWRHVTDGATAAGVPIVALTAHVGQDERDLCREAGMVDYLSKPFDIEALAATARRWLDPGQDGPAAPR